MTASEERVREARPLTVGLVSWRSSQGLARPRFSRRLTDWLGRDRRDRDGFVTRLEIIWIYTIEGWPRRSQSSLIETNGLSVNHRVVSNIL